MTWMIWGKPHFRQPAVGPSHLDLSHLFEHAAELYNKFDRDNDNQTVDVGSPSLAAYGSWHTPW